MEEEKLFELAKKFGDNYTYGKIVKVLKEKFIDKEKLSQIEKENKLGDWLRKNHPKIWEKWLDTLPSATDLRKEFHKAGIKKI